MANLFSKSNKAYVSEATEFLREFDKNNPELSESQQAEVKKYQRLNQLRDQVAAKSTTTNLWKDFFSTSNN